VSDLGAVDTSSGDVLDATFHSVKSQAPKAAKGISTGEPKQSQTIATALQIGHVVITHKAAPKPGVAAPVEQQATGQRGVYDGDTERLTVTGTVQLTEPGGVLWADRMVMEQQSGDVAVDGAVKASYRQSASSEPVHILASRGDIGHDSGIAFFYGVPGTPARMWQNGSQVDAPVLRFDQKQRTLLARGDGQGADGAVHTTLVNAAPPKDGAQNNNASLKKPEPVRVVSRELTYSDTTHKAEFTGGVDVTRVDGTMRAQQATLFLHQPAQTAATSRATSGQAGFMGGQVERMVADGHVEMNQPGRRATGERLVYTAADGMYVLTGTSTVAPLIHDEAQGTTTGCALRFHAGDNSVVVSSEGCSGQDQKARSESQVKDRKR
jgi:lipopolysaccharide export system protein LptA